MNNQTAQLLEQHFDTAFAAPDGIKKLRELILTLAMQGRLVAQDPNDPPARELLKEIEGEKRRLVKEGKIKAPKLLPEVKTEEVPYALPMGWEWVRLGSVSEINGGFAFKSSKYTNDGIRVIRISDFDEKGFKNDKIVRYLYSNDLRSFALEPNSILMAMTGGTVGKSLLVKELPEPMVVNQRVATIRILPGVISEYINSLIQTNLIQKVIHTAKNSTNDNISMGDITGFYVPLSPLPEQHRIVAKIDQLMARCDELERLRAEREQKRLAIHTAALRQLLDAQEQDNSTNAWQFLTRHFNELYSIKENVAELRKAILQLAVMGKLVPQNPNDPPASELLKEIEAEKQRLVKAKKIKKPKPTTDIALEDAPFRLPSNWQWARLSSISQSIDYGTSQKTGEDSSLVPVYRMGNIVEGKLVDDGFKYISPNIDELPHLYLKPNDILFNRTNSYELVGKSARYSGQDKYATFASYLIRVRLFERQLLPAFFSSTMNSPYFRATQIEPEIVQQCGQANFNGTKLSLCLVPVPPLPEQHRIVAKIDKLMTLCDKLDQQIDAATGKQTKLLNALMAQV